MRNREKIFITFSIFLILSLTIFLLNRISPLSLSGLRLSFPFENNKEKQLYEENLTLRKKLVDQQIIERENRALSDQFSTTQTSSLNLLVARIIGMPSFVPGITTPAYYIINKGLQDGVATNQAVLYKDNVVGKVISVSDHASKVLLVTSTDSSFTSKTMQTNALGVVKGQEGQDLIFSNVLASDTLQLGDFVITNGGIDEKNTGYPPNLVVGQISSVDKKPSALFQSASIQSKLDFTKLTTVFVVLGYK